MNLPPSHGRMDPPRCHCRRCIAQHQSHARKRHALIGTMTRPGRVPQPRNAGPLLGRALFALASLQPCQVRLAALKNYRQCGKRIPKGQTSGYLIRGYALLHLIFMKHEKLKSDEKSLHLPPQKGGPAQKVKWSDSPAVKRGRSMSSVLSAKASSNIIHEASGKW